jgi:hypothetical protein
MTSEQAKRLSAPTHRIFNYIKAMCRENGGRCDLSTRQYSQILRMSHRDISKSIDVLSDEKLIEIISKKPHLSVTHTVTGVTPTVTGVTPTVTGVTPTVTGVTPTVTGVTPTVTEEEEAHLIDHARARTRADDEDIEEEEDRARDKFSSKEIEELGIYFFNATGSPLSPVHMESFKKSDLNLTDILEILDDMAFRRNDIDKPISYLKRVLKNGKSIDPNGNGKAQAVPSGERSRPSNDRRRYSKNTNGSNRSHQGGSGSQPRRGSDFVENIIASFYQDDLSGRDKTSSN